MAAHKQCITRLQKEYKSLLKDPVPNITAHPSPSNLLEWHYVLEGTKGTEYEGGVYHGKLVFPPEYPFKPPSISLFTPNGRFATNTKLCLSMTDFHPESWNPMWSVGTILTGLLSFMYDTQATTGSITTSKQEKERLAKESLAFNAKNPTFRKLFPAWLEELARRQAAPPPTANDQPPAPPPATNENGNGQHAANEGEAPRGPGEQQEQERQADGGEAAVAGEGGAGQRRGGEAGGAARGAGSLVTVVAVVVAVIAVGVVLVSSGAAGSGAGGDWLGALGWMRGAGGAGAGGTEGKIR